MHKAAAVPRNKVQKKTTKKQKQLKAKKTTTTAKRGIRLTRVTRGGDHHTHEHQDKPGTHTNKFGSDPWYNPDEDSDHVTEFAHPPSGVFAYPFATKPYKFFLRTVEEPDVSTEYNIYEGETYWDAARRQGFVFKHAICTLPSQMYQEESYFEGPPGCDGCIGYFPFDARDKLRQMTDTETQRVREFWTQRVNPGSTNRDGGTWKSVRYLCTLNFEPQMDGVEVYLPGKLFLERDDRQFIGRTQDEFNV